MNIKVVCNDSSQIQARILKSKLKEKGFNIVYTDINKDKLVGQKIENGGEIFNDYTNNIASGNYSHAEGYKTKAYADYSHAEGQINWTYGLSSHAEGNNSNALTDYILSHTAPISEEPTYLFLNFIDQSKVDKTMENFLEKVKNQITFTKWFFGHYHDDAILNDKFRIMFNDIIELDSF